MNDAYHFGQLAKQFDIFAYPRTGSHLFSYCFGGLFDLISLPNEYLHAEEAVDRQTELREEALYALELRENGAPYQPVWLNATATGLHGMAAKGENPAILLIRDPIAAAYSLFRVSPRWGLPIPDPLSWLESTLHDYAVFYEAGFTMLTQYPDDTLLVRYEELTAGPQALQDVVRFVGLRPKLRPDFVHRVTRFEAMVRSGERTFYREGRNTAWMEHPEWLTLLCATTDWDFRPFGYGQVSSYLP